MTPKGTGTKKDVDAIKGMEDAIEKAASTKGYLVDIRFVDTAGADTFKVDVDPSKGEVATNWSGGDPVGFAHELHHMFAFEPDRYDYTIHASNESMEIPDRLYWFRKELKKPANYNDPTSIMNSAAHPNDDDACRVAGLDVTTCVPARVAARGGKTVARPRLRPTRSKVSRSRWEQRRLRQAASLWRDRDIVPSHFSSRSCGSNKSLYDKQLSRAEPCASLPWLNSSGLLPRKPFLVLMTLMQRRFGHDFSRVRVHTDGTAAESARAVNAVAYTVGRDVVFGAGSYSPRSDAGRSLLAHELTHVVQQNFGAQRIASPFSLNRPNDPAEREAAQMGRSSFQGREPQPSISIGFAQVQWLPADQEDDFHTKLTEEFRASHGLPVRGEDESGQPLSPSDAEIKYKLGPLAFAKEQAAAIISRAKNSKVSLSDRAVEAVKSIVREYHDESLVSDVTYVEKTRGLSTTPVGKGSSAKGKLTVGRYFIEHIDQFARRVLQVGHELQHVNNNMRG